MTTNALPMTPTMRPSLRVIGGGRGRADWWERRSTLRSVVGGCPDHWWKPTAPRTTACTCDRFAAR